MKRIEYIEKTNTLIGTKRKELIDKETGEIIEVDQITKKVYGQKNFWKLYLSDFLHVLGGIENKQVAILKYILDNTHPSTNMFIGTYKTIQKNTHTSGFPKSSFFILLGSVTALITFFVISSGESDK